MELSPTEKILKAARKIPKGKVATYKDIARAAGNPALARLVGTLMRKNRDRKLPCHRVIRADGTLGRYSLGGTKRKASILSNEGVKIKNGKIDLSVFRAKL